jgi:diacylglycerol kinase (ATP)
MGPEVVKKVLDSGRPLGPAFAYYQSIIRTFFSYRPYTLHAKAQDWQWSGKVRTFAVANGKYYGHGLCIAPDAVLDDGVFDIFAAGNVSVLDFIIQSRPLKQGKRISHPQVSYKKASSVELYADHPGLVEADGEVLGWLPAQIEIIPKKLKLLC